MSRNRSDDRDRQPPKSPPLGVPVWTADEGTGVHEGEELDRIRSRRPTPERLSRLERRQDKADAVSAETRIAVGRIEVAVGNIRDDLAAERKARAERLDNQRRWVLKVGGGLILIIAGGFVRWLVG